MKKIITQTEQLIFLSSKTYANIETINSFIKKNNIDWEYFVKKIVSHRIFSLVYYNFNKITEKKYIPTDVFLYLKKLYNQNLAKNLILQKELEKILKLTNDIEIIVLKGLPLAEFIYGNIGLRFIGDIDLLVKETDLEKIQKILLSAGFKISDYSTKIFYRFYHKHFHFVKKLENGQKVFLEIHWNIVKKNEPFKIDLEKIWKNKITLKNNSIPISTLSLEDTMLYAGLHLYQHNYAYLCFLVDVSEILKFGGKKTNWEKVFLLAKNSNLKNITYFGLSTAKKYFDAPIPFEILQKFSPFYYKKFFINRFICSQISQQPFLHKNFLKNIINAIIQFIIIRFVMIDDFKQSFKYFLKKIFPSREELKFRYNISSPKLYLFFYFIHPFLLILKLKKYKYVERNIEKVKN